MTHTPTPDLIAPERIWAKPEHPDENGYGGFWIKARVEPSVEYVRADLCDPTQDDRVRALVDAVKAMPQDWYYDGCDCKPCEALHAALRALEEGEG